MSAVKHQPATPLPQLAVQWDEAKERVSLITLGNHPHDYVLASSKDSGKGKVYECIAHAANAYPKLVEKAREFLDKIDSIRSDEFEIGAEREEREALRALLRELGEAS